MKSSSSPTGDQAPLGAEGGQKRISPFALPPRGEKEDLEGPLVDKQQFTILRQWPQVVVDHFFEFVDRSTDGEE